VQIVKEADLLDEATGVLIIVTVITLASTQEGKWIPVLAYGFTNIAIYCVKYTFKYFIRYDIL